MPFRGVVKDGLKPGEPVQLVVAEDGDVEVQIGIKPYGATGTSGAPNYWVGGPGIATEFGKLVTSNEYTTGVEAGDELWVMTAEDLSFATTWTITALIRSSAKARRNGNGNGGRHASKPADA